MKIPLDTDSDGLPDAWEALYGFNAANVNNSGWDDDRNEGGMMGKNFGDRMPAFDEYRGFMVSGTHKRTDPLVKQIFVYSPDSDPFLTEVEGNEDGLNRDTTFGPKLKVGAYAADLDAEIMLIQAGEFDAVPATLGDVNYNSPKPYGAGNGIKQKYVSVVTDLEGSYSAYGRTEVYTIAQPLRGPNRIADLEEAGANTGKFAAVINLGQLRSRIAYIDGDAHTSKLGGPPAKHMLFRGSGALPADPRRDPLRHIIKHGVVQPQSLYYFNAADKICWHDRNNDGHWDRGDELWIDANGNGINNNAETVIFDVEIPLAANAQGTLLDATSEFRYVRQTDPNTVGQYAELDDIYTTYFNRSYYTAARDMVLAHEVVGHPSELVHTSNNTGLGYSLMHSDDPVNIAFTANGILVLTQTGGDTYIDPPTTFRDTEQNTTLQLRE